MLWTIALNVKPRSTPETTSELADDAAVGTSDVAPLRHIDPPHVLEPMLALWPAPALLVDSDGVVLSANDAAAALLDITAESAHGRMLAGLLGVPATRALLVGAGSARLAAAAERPALRARARRTETGDVVVGFHVEDGPAVDLEHAERLASIGELLSSVAHELNNPLTSVLGYAELLLADDHPDLPRDELQRIHDEAARCRRIVQNLLDLSRAERVESRPLLVGDVVARVVEFRSYAAHVAGVTLRGECEEDLPVMVGDFHRLVQAVLNLVTNAEHAVAGRAAGRSVTVRARRAGPRLAIEVEDNGAGVRPEDAERIFEPFVTTKPRGRGTGLGLSLVRNTAIAHGGDVRVERSAGGGARFVIELPAATDV